MFYEYCMFFPIFLVRCVLVLRVPATKLPRPGLSGWGPAQSSLTRTLFYRGRVGTRVHGMSVRLTCMVARPSEAHAMIAPVQPKRAPLTSGPRAPYRPSCTRAS